MSQPIFYNDFFTKNGKYILHDFSEWIAYGILRVNDIVNTIQMARFVVKVVF